MGSLCSILRPALLEIPSLSTYLLSFLLRFCLPPPPYFPPFLYMDTVPQTTNIWAKLSLDPTLPTSYQFELFVLALCTFCASFLKRLTVTSCVTKEHLSRMLFTGMSVGPVVSSQASLTHLVNTISHSWSPLSPWTAPFPRDACCMVLGSIYYHLLICFIFVVYFGPLKCKLLESKGLACFVDCLERWLTLNNGHLLAIVEWTNVCELHNDWVLTRSCPIPSSFRAHKLSWPFPSSLWTLHFMLYFPLFSTPSIPIISRPNHHRCAYISVGLQCLQSIYLYMLLQVQMVCGSGLNDVSI